MNPLPQDLLLQAPQLAALHLLETALGTAESVLYAAHAELEHLPMFAEDSPTTRQACLADAVLTHVNALQHAVRRYRAGLRLEASLLF